MAKNYAQPRLSQQAGTIEDLVSQVSLENIEEHIEILSSEPRFTQQRQEEVVDYITQNLEQWGYEVELDPITSDFGNSPGNIIAQLPGTINPDVKFIIGAHYDSVPGSPGADDNASSVAGTLEIARVLQEYQPDATIEFVFFGDEEVGLVGSVQYAKEANKNEIVVDGMFSMDMIGYFDDKPGTQEPFFNIPGVLRVSEEGRETGDFILSLGNTKSVELLKAFQITSNEFVSDLHVITAQVAGKGGSFPDSQRSDHSPFWNNGYQALMLTDTADFRNDNYHTVDDTIDTLDLTFAQQVTQAALATAVITTSELVIDGTEGRDRLRGTSRADQINGRGGRDTLIGLEGNDDLNGDGGRDFLIGVNPNATNPGYREIDTLNGGGGKDFFFLGNKNKVYLNASRIPHPLREQDGDECEPTNKLPIGIHIV